MPNTPVYSLPYPALTNAPNVPADIQALALATDTELQLRVTTYYQQASGDLTLTTSQLDVPGASITLTTTRPNAFAFVDVDIDWNLTGTGTGYCYGFCVVDGVTQGGAAIFVAQSAETRTPGHRRWPVTLASVGAHTIKIQGKKDSASGTAIHRQSGTAISIELFQ